MGAQSMTLVARNVDDNDDDIENNNLSQDFFHTDTSSALSAAAQPTNFVKHFSTSNGPPQLLFICFMLALASGCTVGVVRSDNCSVIKSSALFVDYDPFFFIFFFQIPAVMTDRFARKNHDYDGMDCFAFSTTSRV